MKKLLSNSKNKALLILALLIFAPIIITISCDKDCDDPTNPDCPNYVAPCTDSTNPDCPNYVEPCNDPTNPDCPNYDSCYQIQLDYALASDNYFESRVVCLQIYLPRCFDEIEGFKGVYDYCLPRDDSLLSVINSIKLYVNYPEYLIGHEELVDSAKTTATRAMNQQAIMDSIYNANQGCLR
ncbi:MAG TPA: hypothetical protein PK124_07995 [Bacteroidales bacterium]|nr:hypothetical protein [Bacteroidales bacterium]